MSDGLREPREGEMTLCATCNKAIQLLRTRNPDNEWDYHFWAHVASMSIRGPIETHTAYPKRSMWDYDCYGQPL